MIDVGPTLQVVDFIDQGCLQCSQLCEHDRSAVQQQ